ncbi:MAG TPA: hypothetical protein ENN42_06530 [Thioalkalivibrio sp.]|nr:hypothetical protein [Thioalkalivibrio sp.]
MNDISNPYQAPEANLVAETSGGDWTLAEPRRVPVSHGWKWIADAFRLFARSPGIWIVNLLIFWVLAMVASVLPLVGMLATIPIVIMTGGLMRGAYELDRGESGLKIDHLFVGFRDRLGRLAAIGGLYLLATIVIMFAVMIPLFAGIGFIAASTPALDEYAVFTPMIIAVAVMFVLFIPVTMAYWFAPALAMMHEDADAIRAMKLSLVGCLRNILPLIVYGVIMTLLLVLASIPLFLGLLVMGPVMVASMYTGYRDIFVTAADDEG